MNRKALIIGVPGDNTEKEYLDNVWHDMKNMKEFLISNNGGEWLNSEIQIMYPNPSLASISAEIKKIKADYSLVYYAGHGGFKKAEGLTYLWINNQWIAENWLYGGNETKRQMMILDTCRTYINESLNLSEQSKKFTAQNIMKSLSTRHLFDKAVLDCEEGLIKCYSSSENQSADDSEATGGYFTYSLIKAGESLCQGSTSSSTFSIKQVYDLAQRIIKQYTPIQKPELSGGRRFKYFPFASFYSANRITKMTF